MCNPFLTSFDSITNRPAINSGFADWFWKTESSPVPQMLQLAHLIIQNDSQKILQWYVSVLKHQDRKNHKWLAFKIAIQCLDNSLCLNPPAEVK